MSSRTRVIFLYSRKTWPCCANIRSCEGWFVVSWYHWPNVRFNIRVDLFWINGTNVSRHRIQSNLSPGGDRGQPWVFTFLVIFSPARKILIFCHLLPMWYRQMSSLVGTLYSPSITVVLEWTGLRAKSTVREKYHLLVEVLIELVDHAFISRFPWE